MARVVEGLIVEYHNEYKFGVVLLNHRNGQEFHRLIQEYMKDTQTNDYWFAKFTWLVLTDNDRKRICDRVLEIRQSGASNVTVNSFLKGKLATCNVVKDPKWRVIAMIIDVDSGMYLWGLSSKRTTNIVFCFQMFNIHPIAKSVRSLHLHNFLDQTLCIFRPTLRTPAECAFGGRAPRSENHASSTNPIS